MTKEERQKYKEQTKVLPKMLKDKIKKYKGYMNDKGKYIDGTKIQDLLTLNTRYKNFDEQDIESRNNLIIDTFINYLSEEELFK